jgi:hypothetical protein
MSTVVRTYLIYHIYGHTAIFMDKERFAAKIQLNPNGYFPAITFRYAATFRLCSSRL